jgi:hypothetical protein
MRLAQGTVMLLETLLKQPNNSPQLHMRADVYGDAHRAELIRDIMSLANADGGKGPRHILFGVMRDEQGEIEFFKLSKKALNELQNYPQLVLKHLEPDLKVVPSVGEIQGHMVAVLEISQAVNPPYVVKLDTGKELQRGSCWLVEGGLFRPAQRTDLDRMFRSSIALAGVNTDNNVVRVGLADDPNSKRLKIAVPDVRNPPSKLAAARMKGEIEAKKAAAERDFVDTSVDRLIHARLYGNDSDFTEQGLDTLVEGYNVVMERYSAEDNYYYYETNAVKLNLSLVNTGHEALDDVSLMLTLPWAKPFRVSDKLHAPPGKSRSAKESELLGYPKVKIYDKAAQVKCVLGRLEPDQVVHAFDEDLRICVQPEVAGKKVQVQYSLHAAGLKQPEKGELSLIFSK